MGRKPAIDQATGEALLAAYQRLGSQAAAARELGLSEDAVNRFFAGLPKAAAPAVAQQQALVERASSSLWETRTALDDNYTRLLTLVTQLEQGIVLQGGEYVTLTPVATHVAALREIREHIKTAVDLGKLLIDIEAVREWQQVVIDTIGAADEPTRQRIIAALRERRALGLVPH